jgi:hypothetical protein
MSSARLALLIGLLLAFAPAAQAGLSVSNDRTAIATKLGHKFVFHSTIRNDSTAPAGGFVATWRRFRLEARSPCPGR